LAPHRLSVYTPLEMASIAGAGWRCRGVSFWGGVLPTFCSLGRLARAVGIDASPSGGSRTAIRVRLAVTTTDRCGNEVANGWSALANRLGVGAAAVLPRYIRAVLSRFAGISFSGPTRIGGTGFMAAVPDAVIEARAAVATIIGCLAEAR
jgi:hypothetical protein